MVDGGKGQLNIAVTVLKSIGLFGKLDVLGIAKKEPRKGETKDKIFLPGRTNPAVFGRDTDLLLFLQRIRDEAHRFAISFHREKHRAAAIRSELDSIPGIGKKRKQLLLKHYKSIRKIKAATPNEIAAIPGFSLALSKIIVEVMNKGKFD